MNRKVFTYNTNKIGIDLDSILCFYIDGEIDTYHGKDTQYLNVLVGNKIGQPTLVKLIYADFKYNDYGCYEKNINKNSDIIYKELIKNFENKQQYDKS